MDVGNDSMDAGGRATQDAKAEGREHDCMDAGGRVTPGHTHGCEW